MGTALVEGPEGQEALVHAGDLLGKESLKVLSVGRGCLSLENADHLPAKLCVDEGGGPRS